METDDRQSPLRFEQHQHRFQHRTQITQLIIHCYAYGLKRSRGWILPFFVATHLTCHHTRQIQSTLKRLLCTPRHYCLGNRSGKTLFTVLFNHPCQVNLGYLIEPLRRTQPTGIVHAHVQWAILAKTEPALSLVNLR